MLVHLNKASIFLYSCPVNVLPIKHVSGPDSNRRLPLLQTFDTLLYRMCPNTEQKTWVQKSSNGLVQNGNIGEIPCTRENPVTKSKSKKMQSTNSCSDLIAKVAQFGCSKIIIVAMRYPNILLLHPYNFSNYYCYEHQFDQWGNFKDCLSKNQYIFYYYALC